MTTLVSALNDWHLTAFGKIARWTIAILGVATASLTLMLASMMVGGASWIVVLAGVSLAATSTRAARDPSLTRLTTVTANLIVIPLLMRLG